MRRKIIITEVEDGKVDIDICFIKKNGDLIECSYEPGDFNAVHKLLHEARHETVKRIKQKHNQRLGGNHNG